jgi:hypothetical protein
MSAFPITTGATTHFWQKVVACHYCNKLTCRQSPDLQQKPVPNDVHLLTGLKTVWQADPNPLGQLRLPIRG